MTNKRVRKSDIRVDSSGKRRTTDPHRRKGTTVKKHSIRRVKTHYRRERRSKDKIEEVIRKNANKSKAKKKELPLKDRRVLQRRGLY